MKAFYEKDPLLETKFKYSKEFVKTSLNNDQELINLFNIDHKFSFMSKKRLFEEITEEINAIKRIQRFIKQCFFKIRFDSCFSKRIRRTDIVNLEKLQNIKDIAILEESPLRKKKHVDDKKKMIKQKKKISVDPYKKEVIMIRKFNHIFDGKEPAKIRVYYHIFFHTIIIDIQYKNINRTQQITNPLSVFGMKDFNKSYFIKNFNKIILKRLHYVESEQTVYYIKEDEKNEEKKTKKHDPKPGSSPSKSINKFHMSAAERREMELNAYGQKNKITNLFLQKIEKKIQDEYYSMNLYIDLQDNTLKVKAKKYDDPFQIVEKKIFLPSNASLFIEVEKENNEKVQSIFSHYVKNIKDKIQWGEKSLDNEKMSKEFLKTVTLERFAIKIQNAFRRLKEKKNLSFLKFSVRKLKTFIMRKFYKINGSYTDVTFFLLPNKPIVEVNASNLNSKKRNTKIFRINILKFLEKNNFQMKSKENLIRLIIQLLKSLSIKVVNETIHILASEEMTIEEVESYIESDKEFNKRSRRKSSKLAHLLENDIKVIKRAPEVKLLKETNITHDQKLEIAARLIQNHIRILKIIKQKEYFKMIIQAKTIYLMTIIEKIQGNYILAYFYYIKPHDEILINFANLSQMKKILKSYTIDIPSISQELYKMLIESKTSIEKQRPLYYQKLFHSLLKFLWKRIDVSFLYDKITVSSLDKNLKLVDVSELRKKKKYLDEEEKKNLDKRNLKYITTLQKIYRKNKTKYLFNLFKDRLKKLANEEKKYGKKIKQKIKIFNQIPYYIYVYLKSQQMLTFLAIKKERKISSKISRSYHLDKLKLINTNGIDVVDFLISSLRIYDEQIVFDTENLVKLNEESDENPKEIMIDSPEIKRKFYNLMRISGTEKTLLINPDVLQKDINLGFMKPVEQIKEPEIKIIHQKREEINDNQLCVFNVYYKNMVIY